MTDSEREILQDREAGQATVAVRFTSLQATYEDTVPPDDESDWQGED